MTELLATIGNRLTERWLAVLLLPGLGYVAVVGWALLAGHRHALDLPRIAEQLALLWQEHHAVGSAAVVVAVVATLAAAHLAGLAATVLAHEGVHRLWIAQGPHWWRRARCRRAQGRWAARDPRPPSRYLPRRATAIGEAFRLIGARVHTQYGLSVTLAWPRIWVLTSSDTRTLIKAAHRRYYADATVVAWGLLCLPLAVYWWPAAVIAAVALAVGYRRATASGATLATLIEATVDAHATDLANTLGVALPAGQVRVTPEEGNRINDILNKRA